MESTKRLAVGKDKIEISLYLTNGDVLEGSIFLFQEKGPGIFVWKRVLDFLNDRVPYLPFERSDGGIVFVSRGGVARAIVRTPEVNDEDPSLYFGDLGKAKVTLSDGIAAEGAFFIDSPPPRRRISDYLNKEVSFFHLRVDGVDQIISKSHALEVYPLEG